MSCNVIVHPWKDLQTYLWKSWISVNEEFPTIHWKAIDILLLFSMSYMCEHALFYLITIKSKEKKSSCVCLSKV